MWLHLCWREGNNHVPWPAGCGTPRCGQCSLLQAHTADFVGLWSTGSSPVEPLVPACTLPNCVLSHMWDLGILSFGSPIQMYVFYIYSASWGLNSSYTLQYINSPPWFGVTLYFRRSWMKKLNNICYFIDPKKHPLESPGFETVTSYLLRPMIWPVFNAPCTYIVPVWLQMLKNYQSSGYRQGEQHLL